MSETTPGSGRFIAITALLLVVLPVLLFSSPEYRVGPFLAGCGLVSCFAQFPSGGWRWRIFIAGLLLAEAAFFAGGGMNVTSALRGTGGLLGIAGLAVCARVLLEPRWREFEKWIGSGTLVMLLVGSCAGYFISTEVLLGKAYPEPLRLPLVWPTRMPMSWMGQIAWEHTNHAGFVFALGFILTAGSRRWWPLALLSGAAVFLTGSRGAMLMVAVGLSISLIGRPWKELVRVLLLACASIAFGALCLHLKTGMLPKAETPSTLHAGGLVTRGSAGRSSGYRMIWDELEGHRVFGKGLAATGKPVHHLMHEHSIYMATFRGGGLVAVAGHLMVLAASASAAWSLWRGGSRWPAVLLATVLAGLLFDRSSVFQVTGHYEFIAHWVAVLVPLVLTARWSIASGAR